MTNVLKFPKIPDLAKIRSWPLRLRAWKLFRADNDAFPADMERMAIFVELSIKTVMLNKGKKGGGFEWAVRHYEMDLATFTKMFRQRRG